MNLGQSLLKIQQIMIMSVQFLINKKMDKFSTAVLKKKEHTI